MRTGKRVCVFCSPPPNGRRNNEVGLNIIEAYIHEHSSQARKLLELSQFAVYWDFEYESFAELSAESFQSTFRNFIVKSAESRKHFLLKPVSGHSRVIVNKDFLSGVPALVVDVIFETVAMRLSEDHLSCLRGVWAAFKLYKKAERHRQFRPQITVHEAPGKWWKFAINRSVSLHSKTQTALLSPPRPLLNSL